MDIGDNVLDTTLTEVVMSKAQAWQGLTADEVVAVFSKRLLARKTDLQRIASFWNAFEGWLKWELAAGLCADRSRRPWSDESLEATWDTIGVEYRIPQSTRRAARSRGLIDLWVCGSSRKKWHYVELKLAFANNNSGKQIASWRSDLARLEELEDKHAEGCIAILVAVGFDMSNLKKAVGDEATVQEIAQAEDAGTPNATPSVALVWKTSRCN